MSCGMFDKLLNEDVIIRKWEVVTEGWSETWNVTSSPWGNEGFSKAHQEQAAAANNPLAVSSELQNQLMFPLSYVFYSS